MTVLDTPLHVTAAAPPAASPETALTAVPGRIAFPADGSGRRSTSATGRAVVADALRAVDPEAARQAEAEADWRTGYLTHLSRLVEAGLADKEDALRLAAAGLNSLHDRLVVLDDDGGERPLHTLLDAPAERELRTREVVGDRRPDTEVSLPYRGQRLTGSALFDQLDRWETEGVLEPSAATAVRAVTAHPQWLRLDGQVVTVLGAAAEMGPLPVLLGWGATVAAVDLPRPQLWDRLTATARASAGRLLVPVGDDGAAGVDLLREVPALADWLSGLDGRPVVGNYLYADGGTHVALAAAADVLTERLRRARPDVAQAFLATPTDAFVVPADAVAQSRSRYAARSLCSRLLHIGSGARLLQPGYRDGDGPQVCDALVPVQGPNYALAKRLQRWRAAVAGAQGHKVSFHVAPSTRTRSVVKNKALAAAFAGAHRFGVEIFEPDTANTLMALLLVHDLHVGTSEQEHPLLAESHGAVHGGLWRSAYEPRSALTLAAVLGQVPWRG